MKKRRNELSEKSKRIEEDIRKSLPVVVLRNEAFILILSAELNDDARRIKPCEDRIATIGFGVDGGGLQERASLHAMRKAAAYTSGNVHAADIAGYIGGKLSLHLKSPKFVELSGALVVVKLSRRGSEYDEIVAVHYDGTCIQRNNFLSGSQGKTRMGVDVVIGAELPEFEEFLSNCPPGTSFEHIVCQFGALCDKKFAIDEGDVVFIQRVMLDRTEARKKNFRRVYQEAFDPFSVPWFALRKAYEQRGIFPVLSPSLEEGVQKEDIVSEESVEGEDKQV
ncbi:MAG: hypothetical protein HZA35_02205 [Parcubacteria group bacterium]|nr:hypothetical protein [Parcubacteria group bacterium]